MKYCYDTASGTNHAATGQAIRLPTSSTRTPLFDPFDYFPGETRGCGLFEDLFGKVKRQFVVDIEGRIETEMLILEESFAFDDGEQTHRTWKIWRNELQGYSGIADDLVNEAFGRVVDNAVHWNYQMELTVGTSRWKMAFADKMYLQPEGMLLSRARVSKLGIIVGSVTLALNKVTRAD